MKKLRTCTSYTFAFLLFPAAIIPKLPMKKSWKKTVVAVDSVKKQSIQSTLLTINRMLALSNNDTTGCAENALSVLPGALLPYNRIIAFYEIFHKNGILGEIPRRNDQNYTG
jgi:hypothetical protein